MIKTKLKNLILLMFSFCLLLPALFLTPWTSRGGHSTMGVILGPFVGIGDVIVEEKPKTNDWSSNTGVVRNKPNADGSLNSYKSLYVINDKFNTTYKGWKHASFVRYLRIVRTDGRPIYDDDGVMDVSWWNSNGEFGYSDEIVNYAADLYVSTQIMPYNYKGFLGTVLNAKWKSGYFYVTWDRGEDPEEGLELKIKDDDANNMGSGKYRNGGINPGPRYYKLCDMHYHDSPYVTVEISGNAYWENGWWGGSYDFTDVNAFISGFIPRANRNWTNNLTTNEKTGIGQYKGATAFYYPQNYTAVASNLNNYIKVNGVQATPKTGTSVVPFKDGHHIYLSDNVTKIEIENGSENSYKTYYCFIDSNLPDINYNFYNSNALDFQRVGTITTDTTGAKTQTTTGAIFKDAVQVNFGYDENTESPETATYTYGGKTYNLKSGTWLTNEGSYTVMVKDLAGNTTIHKFTIDKSAPSYNLSRLQNDTNYKISKWYLSTIPYGYTGAGTYSFKEQVQALNHAFEIEKSNCVTSYTLNNINDFTDTGLVANGNTVKVGPYWYYKSKNNPNLYVYYFDEYSLNEAIDYYSSKFVSEQVYKINSSLSPNDYGNKIDKSVYDNIIKNGYIANDFIFKQENVMESKYLFYDFQGDDKEEWFAFSYNTKFGDIVTTNGLYKIREVDVVGHETFYFVYVDKQSPLLDFEATNYGSSKSITKTISSKDIPNNSELVFYYEKFKITNVIDDDKWWTLEIKCPDGKIKRYTYLDDLPNFEDLGSGEFNVTIADRTNQPFKFKVYLLGKAPEVKFETINANTQLKISIIAGEKYNQITDLKIYRNGICLNSELGYDEYPDRTDDALIFITPTTLRYTFGRGGIYVVEVTDTFGRTLSYEFKFEKDLPTGILTGVEHNGKTKDQVQFVFNNSKYFVVINKNNAIYEPTQNIEKNITTLFFNPEENTEFVYSIKLVDYTDTDNYNIYVFTIKTIKPIINLVGVAPNGKTGGDVYATWQDDDEQYTATYSNNDVTETYRKGQILSVQGNYTITLTDSIGNFSQVNFEIDKTIDFIISDTKNKQYKIDEIEFINFDIKLIALEPLSAVITRNNSRIDYDFGYMLTDEGEYTVRLYDEYNNSIFFTFTIDKTPPKVALYGVENFGITSGRVWLAAQEAGLKSWLVRNTNFTSNYKLGDEIIQSGNYIVYVEDKAKNRVSFEFTIDTEIEFEINTYYGGISNGGVRIIAYENLKIVMYKDDKPFDYEFEKILNEDGEYSFTLFDELGNKTSFFFSIITKKKQNLKHILQENISVENITKDDEIYEANISKNELYLFDEGAYNVEVLDAKTNQKYSFKITIDTTPPTLELVNVENGGTTKKVVILRNVSEKPYTLNITVDGVPFDYKLGDEIEKCGRFVVVLTDEAGNSTTYTFERVYSLNGPSVAILAGLGALVVLLIILLIKSRKRYDEDTVVEEEIEETVVDDDVDSEDDENNENNKDEHANL